MKTTTDPLHSEQPFIVALLAVLFVAYSAWSGISFDASLLDGGVVTFTSHDKNSRTTDDDTWQGVTLTSRNDLSLKSADDLIATGATMKSGGKTTLEATNGQVALLAGDEEHNSTRSIDQDGNAGAFATNKRTQNDRLAIVTQVDASGGLSITSKGDQTYEGTHITSGGPTELTSTEGGIHFALATDDHSSTHDKSSSNSNWVSSDTKGDITQTLHGVEIDSATPVIVNAAKDVQVDIAHLDNADVNQMIDAMVQADPKLAWMKDMAARGDVDINQVKAVAQHWHEHHQGAGQGLSLAVAVVATVMTGGAGAGVAATMMSAGESAIASQAVLTTMANNGHLDDTVKDITSKDSLQNLAVTMASAGVTQGVVDKYLGGTTNQYQITHGFDLNDTSLKSLENMQGAYGFVLHGAAQGLADAALDTAIKGGSFNDYLKTNMEQQGNNVLSALAFNEAGNLGIEGMTNSKTHVGFNAWADGGVAHVLTHAAVGAVVGKIVDGNATAGAAAAAFNEALTPGLESSLGEGKWHAAGVQFAGGYAAMLAGGSANTGSTIAKQADGYNRQLHKEEMRALTGAVDGYADLIGTDDRNKAIDQLLLQANRTVDAGYNASIKNNPVAEAYLNVVNAQYASTHDGKQLFHTTPLSYADATAGADHLYEIENIPSLGDGQPNRIRTAMLNGVTSGQASSDAAKETMNVMDWEGDQKSAELGGQAAGVLGLAVTLPVGGMAAKGLYDGGAAVVTEAIEFAKNPLLYYLANPGTVAGVTEAGIFTVAGVPQANSLLPEISFTQQAKQLEQEVAGGLRSVTMPSGSLVSNKVDNISTTELEGVLGQRYEGVKEASQFLQDAGVSREVRKQVLESFDIKTLNLRQATDGEFGIRYFDNVNASEKGRYLFEAFPASRQSLALKPEWNQMTYMKQFQIRPNTTILEGRASSMGVGIEGGQIQKYVLDMNDLLEPK